MSDALMMPQSVDMLDYWEQVVGRPPEDTMIDVYTAGFLVKKRFPDASTEAAHNFGLTVHARAAWARDGFPTFRLSHGLTSALLMTDSDSVPLDQVQFPFSVFTVQFPGPDYTFIAPADEDGPSRAILGALVQIVTTPREWEDYSAALVKLKEGTEAMLALPDETGDSVLLKTTMESARTFLATVPLVRGLYLGLVLAPREGLHRELQQPLDTPVLSTFLEGRESDVTTVGGLLDSFKGKVLFRGDASKERGPRMLGMFHAIGRLVLNLALYVTNSEAPEPRGKPVRSTPVRSPSVHSTRAITPRVWVVGNEVKLSKEVRAAARRIVEEGHGRMPWRISARFMVRGHFREQPHGPGRSLRRRQWIAPFWKGQDSAVALTRQYAVGEHEEEPHERPGGDQ